MSHTAPEKRIWQTLRVGQQKAWPQGDGPAVVTVRNPSAVHTGRIEVRVWGKVEDVHLPPHHEPSYNTDTLNYFFSVENTGEHDLEVDY